MTASRIRHTRNGSFYARPVLLDQQSMIRLVLVSGLLLAMIFISGYLLGFQKAEARLANPFTQLALALPESAVAEVAEIEPQIPLFREPGESIDVDSADKEPVEVAGVPVSVVVTTQQEKMTDSKHKSQRAAVAVPVEPAESMAAPVALGVGGPVVADELSTDGHSALYDNARPESARYSIQVGMYSQLDNAERRVKELASAELNAYYDDYLNGDNETRYNVRFGYFSDRRSAREALAAYQQETGGSGYIVNLRPVDLQANADDTLIQD